VFPTSELLKKAAALWHLLRHGDLAETPHWTKILIYPVRVLLRTFEEFVKDKCLLRASALAYASLLALVPVTAIFFFILTRLEAFSTIRESVEQFLFQNLIPARTDVVQQYLTQYTQNVMVLGAFGLVALFVTAIFLFNSVEHTINDIWQAKQSRPFLSKFMSFWTVLTAVPLLVIFSFYVATNVDLRNAAGLDAGGEGFFEHTFLAYLLNWLAFWFAYQFIPYTRVRVWAAVTGGVVGGTLWELAKGGFNWYITNMTAFDQVYGPLATIPVFLLWLYLTWVIVLFGAEVAYAVQYPRERRHLTQEELASYMDFYSVRAMAEISRRFGTPEDSKKSTIDILRGVGVPPEIMGEILNRLAERQLIVYTEDKDYVPARQPSKIMVRDVIEAVSGKKLMTPDTAGDAVSMRLQEKFKEATEGVDSAIGNLDLETLTDGGDE
jgi:membrane protein